MPERGSGNAFRKDLATCQQGILLTEVHGAMHSRAGVSTCTCRLLKLPTPSWGNGSSFKTTGRAGY